MSIYHITYSTSVTCDTGWNNNFEINKYYNYLKLKYSNIKIEKKSKKPYIAISKNNVEANFGISGQKQQLFINLIKKETKICISLKLLILTFTTNYSLNIIFLWVLIII